MTVHTIQNSKSKITPAEGTLILLVDISTAAGLDNASTY